MTPDITELAHQRGGDGQLLPIEKSIEVRGEGEATVKVKPATSGERREWKNRLEDEGDNLDDEITNDLFDTFLPNYSPSDFGNASEWAEIRPALEDALANAIFSELFDTEEDDFSEALQGAMETLTEGNLEAAED